MKQAATASPLFGAGYVPVHQLCASSKCDVLVQRAVYNTVRLTHTACLSLPSCPNNGIVDIRFNVKADQIRLPLFPHCCAVDANVTSTDVISLKQWSMGRNATNHVKFCSNHITSDKHALPMRFKSCLVRPGLTQGGHNTNLTYLLCCSFSLLSLQGSSGCIHTCICKMSDKHNRWGDHCRLFLGGDNLESELLEGYKLHQPHGLHVNRFETTSCGVSANADDTHLTCSEEGACWPVRLLKAIYIPRAFVY